MRILIVLLFLICGYSVMAQQWLAGGGITYCSYVDGPGINVSITHRVIGDLHIGPDISVLLTRERNENGITTKRKETELNINAHQLFDLGEKISWYPLTGVNFSRVTDHPVDDEPRTRWMTGLNLGGGFELEISGVRVFAEYKYVLHFAKFDITTGIIFEL